MVSAVLGRPEPLGSSRLTIVEPVRKSSCIPEAHQVDRPARPICSHAIREIWRQTALLDARGASHPGVIEPIWIRLCYGIEELRVLAGCDLVLTDLVRVDH